MSVTVETKQLSLLKIKLNKDNPRQIGKREMANLIKSLKEFPDMMRLREIVVDEDGVIIGGNMRYLALREIGEKAAQVKIVKGLTDEQKREFVIKDNAAFGVWDWDALANGWDDLPLVDWGVDLPEDWLAEEKSEPADAEPQIDKASELNKVWKVAPGDLYQIGEHRLLCGDSTKKEDVGRVMGGEKADMVFTDPPYGINLDVNTDVRNRSTPKFRKPNQKSYQPIAGDDADYLPEHIFRDFGNVKEIFLWGADYYAERIPEKNQGCFFVWDKRQESSDAMIGSAFELCWSKTKHKREIIRVLWCGLLGTESQDVRKRIHPTQKPLQLCNWFFEKFSKQDDIIIDLFLGSGTTMVACQNLNRKCRGIEISPDYCAVILQRMADAFPELEIRRINA